MPLIENPVTAPLPVQPSVPDASGVLSVPCELSPVSTLPSMAVAVASSKVLLSALAVGPSSRTVTCTVAEAVSPSSSVTVNRNAGRSSPSLWLPVLPWASGAYCTKVTVAEPAPERSAPVMTTTKAVCCTPPSVYTPRSTCASFSSTTSEMSAPEAVRNTVPSGTACAASQAMDTAEGEAWLPAVSALPSECRSKLTVPRVADSASAADRPRPVSTALTGVDSPDGPDGSTSPLAPYCCNPADSSETRVRAWPVAPSGVMSGWSSVRETTTVSTVSEMLLPVVSSPSVTVSCATAATVSVVPPSPSRVVPSPQRSSDQSRGSKVRSAPMLALSPELMPPWLAVVASVTSMTRV
ncbi:hypothetical protein DSECCO2_615170 [anaerobic digester metagenome]